MHGDRLFLAKLSTGDYHFVSEGITVNILGPECGTPQRWIEAKFDGKLRKGMYLTSERGRIVTITELDDSGNSV